MDGEIIVTSPHCTKGVNTRVLMHANTKDLKHSDGGAMDNEDYIAQLTDEEQADVALQRRAREIIEAREPEKPEIDVRYAMFSRKHGVEIAHGARMSRVYFPTEESRDEGYRRAIRAAMEYSLWSQLYPGGYYPAITTSVAIIDAGRGVVTWGWSRAEDLFNGGSFLLYRTKADAQRVADILKREGV